MKSSTFPAPRFQTNEIRQSLYHKSIMANLWEYIKNIFQEVEQSSPSNPVIHAMIERTEEHQLDYQRWLESLVKRRLIDWLNDQYAIYQILPEDIDEAIDFLNTPSSKGFVIHFHKMNYNKQEITHLFDHFRNQMRAHNYKVQISDTRTYNRKNWVETVERHYLKPRTSFEQGKKINQGFGNITIEMVLRNDQVYQLKFQATSYQDRLYDEAADFRDLMQYLGR